MGRVRVATMFVLGLAACATPPTHEPDARVPVQVGLGPDVYPLVSYVPDGAQMHLLGREAVVQQRGVAAILGGMPRYKDGRPHPARYTPLDPFPRRFMLPRHVAYVSSAKTRDERLSLVEGERASATTDVRVNIEGNVYLWEFEGDPPDLDPARPIVTGVYVAESVDYVSEHDTWAGNGVAVRLGGIEGPPGELLVESDGEQLQLEARVLPSARIVVWSMAEAPALLWASGRLDGFDPASLIDAQVDDPQCRECPMTEPYALRRNVALPSDSPLEVTYLGWGARDVPEPLTRTSWAAYRASLQPHQVRTETVEIEDLLGDAQATNLH